MKKHAQMFTDDGMRVRSELRANGKDCRYRDCTVIIQAPPNGTLRDGIKMHERMIHPEKD